ncbi:LuxR C-terminal-related transcriptional regulator [Dictyobacter arantiisoli]|uniref:LuxR family transcriptional regulator n=1 Tax=Dictyobacter arantiisoli TaxID=2014874 RepID=A0A5A5T599_9CHLR|nr:LuxR C-terminal-related transcriptional regulator [Dictyobacter arantiisoli]GCF06550.1 LuxR family transcriptional regulator [Dictyobacter arantiisoli]
MERGIHDPLLITTKLAIPPQYLNRLIPRTHVYTQMDAGLQRPFILVTAPAGFGKTTLVSEWIRQRHVQAVWVSLEETDNDLLRFWHYALTALHPLHLGLDALLADWETTLQSLSLENILTHVINISMDITQEIVLVLDDYHTINTPAIHQSLMFLLEHLPPNFHLILLTRHDPPLPLARLRVQGKLSELRSNDLRFTLDETSLLLSQTMQLELTSNEITELHTRTEGWIAGLQLAALSLQYKESASAKQHFIQTFTGINKNVMNYLTDEVLLQQPEEVQDFLLKTAILEQLNVKLCDAITGQHNSEAMLEWLERHNLFLNILDSQQAWYRYDQLFRDLLCYRLNQKYPELKAELHHNAGNWYEEHGMISDAIKHAIAAEAMQHAAQLIEQHAWTFIQQGDGLLLLSWLRRLPEQIFNTCPMLSFLQACMHCYQAQMENFEAALKRAELGWQQTQNQASLSCAYDLRARVALYRGQAFLAIKYAQQALSLISEEQAPLFYSSALVHLGAGYLNVGNCQQAQHYLAEGYRLSQKHHAVVVTLDALLYLGYLQRLQGNLRLAQQTWQQMLSEISTRFVAYQIVAHILLADIYREWNELASALEHQTQAQKLAEHTQYEDIATSQRYLITARLVWLQNDPETAFSFLDQAEQSSQRFGIQQTFLAQLAEIRIHFLLAQRDQRTARQWLAQSTPELCDSMPVYEKESWIKAHARLLIDQTQSQAAQQLLKSAYQIAHEQGRTESAIALLILLTLAYHMEGNTQYTLQTLEQALILAEPNGYTRIFVDEGDVMAALLTELYSRYQRRTVSEPQNIALGYLYTLLTIFGADAKPPLWLVSQENDDILIDRLSEREYMVLGLIAEGLSNQEIAQKLVVTVSTIKTHLNNIYAKLHVHTRLQAVTRAYDLGVLRRSEVDTEPLAHSKSTEK